MSYISSSFKLLSCCAIAGGMISPSYFYSSFPEEKASITLENTVQKELPPKEKKAIKLGKPNKGQVNLSLINMKNVDQLLKGTKKRLNFGEIGMKFGDKTLSPNDILFSPCQNGIYYLLQPISVRENKYKLEDGKVVRTSPRCHEKSKYEHLPSISLSWTRPPSWDMHLSLITVGSCFLFNPNEGKKVDSPKLRIICAQFLNQGRGDVLGEFGNDSFEY